MSTKSGILIFSPDGEVIDYPGASLRGSWPQEVRENAIAYRIEGGEYRDTTLLGEEWPHHRWTLHYNRQGRKLQIGYMTGTGLQGAPLALDGLESAFADARSVEGEDFEDWADSYGYDKADPIEWRRAQNIFRACERMQDRLERFFPGEEFEQWQTAIEDGVNK